jgi:hypothetical protein
MAAKRLKKARVTVGKLAEPMIENCTKVELINALNWYNYNSEDTDYKDWLKDYLATTKFDKKVVSAVVNNARNFSRSYAAVARLESRGVDTGYRARLDEVIKTFASEQIEEVVIEEKGEVISIRDRLDIACNKYIEYIDQQIDGWITDKTYKTNFYDFLNNNGCKGAHARVIANHYQQAFANIKQLKKNNPDLAEYYDYSAGKKKQLIALYDALQSDLSKLEQTKKAQRVRRVRKVSVDKILSKVKYCKESTEFKIGSIHPQKVLGNDQLWVFNTKTRQLGRYLGSNLSFKRSSLMNYDLEKSMCKKLRKPEDILKIITGSSKSQCNKTFDAIKAIEKPMNGRLNEFIILVRAF